MVQVVYLTRELLTVSSRERRSINKKSIEKRDRPGLYLMRYLGLAQLTSNWSAKAMKLILNGQIEDSFGKSQIGVITRLIIII